MSTDFTIPTPTNPQAQTSESSYTWNHRFVIDEEGIAGLCEVHYEDGKPVLFGSPRSILISKEEIEGDEGFDAEWLLKAINSAREKPYLIAKSRGDGTFSIDILTEANQLIN